MTSPAPDPKRKPTREEIALIEVGHTDIGRGTTWLLILAFIALIAAVPLIEVIGQLRAGGVAGVRALELVRDPPRLREFTYPVHRAGIEDRNRFHEFEKRVEEGSAPRQAFARAGQHLLTGLGRTGNSKVVLGRDGWLFYRPGLDYLLAPDVAGTAWRSIHPRRHGDALAAIRALHRDCVAAGARLVVVPMADKAQIHPEMLASAYHGGEVIDNPGYAAFTAALAAEGIALFEPATTLRAAARIGPTFLAQDTHWTPDAMALVAFDLARSLGAWKPEKPVAWTTRPVPATRVGDLVDTLKLPENQTLYAPVTVTVQQVVDPDGRPWSADPDSDVLLLGDSFANIYTVPGMGWGEAAGLAPHLAWRLGQPIDVIAKNGGGATAVRQELAARARPFADRLQKPFHPLDGKRLVIWEFSIRDLGVEEWRPVALERRQPAAKPPVVAGSEAAPAAAAVIEVELTHAAKVADPTGLPYLHAIGTWRGRVTTVVSGSFTGTEALLFVQCMRDRVLLPAAQARVGQRLRLTVRPWSEVEKQYRTERRYDLGDDEPFDLEPYWVAQSGEAK